MNAAKLEKSPRLQRVYEALQKHGPLTTMQIIQTAKVCAVNSIIAELRANQIPIDCKCLEPGVYQYRLERLF